MTQARRAPVRLRVGVLVDGPRVSRHLRDLLAFLEFEPTLHLAGVWYPGELASDTVGGLSGRCRRALYRLDARLARLGAQDAGHGVQRVDVSPWLQGQTHGTDVDLMVRAGTPADARLQPMLAGVRYGAIGLDFSLSAPPDEAGLALDECLSGAHQAGVVLYATPAAPDSPWVIREGWFQTHWSLGRTRAVLMAAGLRMLKDAILQCQRWHAAQLDGGSGPDGGRHQAHEK
ncbi:MAG: hypothetical protein Q4E06_06630, partial [Lautropia sp.]|nr:hypothetical protein [Lautropia sp.]